MPSTTSPPKRGDSDVHDLRTAGPSSAMQMSVPDLTETTSTQKVSLQNLLDKIKDRGKKTPSFLALRPLSDVSSRNIGDGKRNPFLILGVLTLIMCVLGFLVIILSLLQVDGYIPKIWVQ